MVTRGLLVAMVFCRAFIHLAVYLLGAILSVIIRIYPYLSVIIRYLHLAAYFLLSCRLFIASAFQKFPRFIKTALHTTGTVSVGTDNNRDTAFLRQTEHCR